MLDIKHQSGLLEAEQNLLQTSAGFNWDSAWQQIHALIRRMKWSFFFRTIKCSPVWRLDKTAARDNSETVKTTRRDSDSLFNWQSLQPAIVISTYSHLRHAPTKSVRVISMSAHSVRFCGQKTNSVFGSYFITSVNWCKGFTVAVKPALYPHPHAPCRLSQSISQGNTTKTHNHRIWSWCENESQSVDKIMQTPRAKENPNFEVDHYYKGSYTGKLSWTPVSCVSAVDWRFYMWVLKAALRYKGAKQKLMSILQMQLLKL